MSQEIKIPVSANTAGAERAAEGLADAFSEVATAVGDIGKATQTANRNLSDLLRRARETRTMLRRELQQDISGGDAVSFMRNFAGMQPRSASLRGFRTEQDWYSGHQRLFRDPRRAAEHRRRVLTYGMQGTSYARDLPPPEAPPGPVGGGGGGDAPSGGGGGGDFQRGLGRAQGMAWGFGKSMLALAGINGVMSMAGRAVDYATEESTGIDALKRRLGDLGVSFDELKTQARSAGAGLGVTYVESQRLAQAYAREVGNLHGANIGGSLRLGMGFSRSFGLDPAAGNQFFGQMARVGVGRDDAGQRRLALLIGDAVARSGYSGKVDELLQAVADFSATSARMTLSTPNAEAYANALTSLTSRGIPGLDPSGAAALIGQADSSIRRGGAMGDASLNFFYAAMRNHSPGIKPVDALALMEGGLFGTTKDVFKGPLGDFMGRGVGRNDVTNLQKVLPMFRQFYGNGGYMINAVKNSFGLSSHAQAAALVQMEDQGLLGASSKLLAGIPGLNPATINASGFATIGAIANAKGMGGLRGVYGNIMERGDLTLAERQKFAKSVGGAMNGGDESAVRRAMVQAVAGLYQEKTPGSETREAITDLTNKLTEAGGPLLSVLNPIRDAVVAMASKIAPGYLDTTGTRTVAPWASGNQGAGRPGSAVRTQIEQAGIKYFMAQGWTQEQSAAIIARQIAESNLDPQALGDHGKARGLSQWHADRWNKLVGWSRERGLDPNDFAAQWGFTHHELTKGDYGNAGRLLRSATNNRQRAGALLAYERPRGYVDGLTDYERVAGWDSQWGQTQRLTMAQTPAPAAGGQPTVRHEVGGEHTVHLVHPNGQKQTVKLPVVAQARPAGTTGGRAPLVGGTISYPTDVSQ